MFEPALLVTHHWRRFFLGMSRYRRISGNKFPTEREIDLILSLDSWKSIWVRIIMSLKRLRFGKWKWPREMDSVRSFDPRIINLRLETESICSAGCAVFWLQGMQGPEGDDWAAADPGSWSPGIWRCWRFFWWEWWTTRQRLPVSCEESLAQNMQMKTQKKPRKLFHG